MESVNVEVGPSHVEPFPDSHVSIRVRLREEPSKSLNEIRSNLLDFLRPQTGVILTDDCLVIREDRGHIPLLLSLELLA